MESSSGLIMSVIRILTNSKDDAERDVIKKKLEDCLAVSDQKLTKLVSDHHKELRLVMQTFTAISKNFQSSLGKLSKAHKRLDECRELLTSRLDELRRLSEESKKNEKILTLLDQVDELFRVPTRINELLQEREYLAATKLLVEKQKYIDDNFDSFDCLQDISADLEGKREEIYKTLRERLFIVDDDSIKEEVIESLKLIDKTPEELPDLDIIKEKVESIPATRSSLFKFVLSSHAICFNEHYKEQIEVTKTLLSK